MCTDKESPHQPPAIAVGDLDGDMEIEVVVGGNPYLYIWDYQGNELQQISVSGLKVYSIAPVLADIDDDNDIEIVIASNNGKIYAYDYDGTEVPFFPLKTDDVFWTSPCIADIDNDGKSELLAGNYSGTMYVWETEGDPSKIEWSCYRNNAHNTGVYNGSMTLSGTLTHDEYWIESAFVVGDVIVPSGITLTIDNSCRVYLTGNATLSIEDGATLILKNWSRIQGICSENSIEVYGDILISNNVIFTAPDGESWGGLYLLKTSATITMNNVTFERGSIFCESRFLVINNSDFTNTGIV
ncbi:MAG: hypothetical protein H8D22_02130, partial [Candidatus Cloacimonetes bacterium]|nr:hypothetical protein [Candidatus Cloacimonadota bacterium]